MKNILPILFVILLSTTSTAQVTLSTGDAGLGADWLGPILTLRAASLRSPSNSLRESVRPWPPLSHPMASEAAVRTHAPPPVASRIRRLKVLSKMADKY